MTAHTPGPMVVMFGGQTCSLHLVARSQDTNAKNRILQLPRDGKLGDTDQNVKFLRNLAAAPDLLDALQTIMRMDVKGHQLQDRLQFSDAGRAILNKALTAIAKATGGTP